MEEIDSRKERHDAGVPGGLDPEVSAILPWELIDTGRYRPRRIRGSYRGRELG